QERLGGEEDRRGERDRRQRAAELLGDQHQLEVAETRPTLRLGHHGAEPAHLGDALPERCVVGHLLGLEDLPADVEAPLLREEFARGMLDELLFLGEFEIHRGAPFDSGVKTGALYGTPSRERGGTRWVASRARRWRAPSTATARCASAPSRAATGAPGRRSSPRTPATSSTPTASSAGARRAPTGSRAGWCRSRREPPP